MGTGLSSSWRSGRRWTGRCPSHAPAVGSTSDGGHIGDQPYEFFIRLYRPVRSRVRLPTPFARVMEEEAPRSLRLHMRGCGNGSIWADVDFPRPHVMYLRQGWKTFEHAHSLSEESVLHLS